MERTNLRTADQALAFYQRVSNATAKSILDFLIGYPNQRFEGADLVERLGLSEHRDVARSTYLMGQIAADLGLQRPWTEGQLGYLMSGGQADLLRQARERTVASATPS